MEVLIEQAVHKVATYFQKKTEHDVEGYLDEFKEYEMKVEEFQPVRILFSHPSQQSIDKVTEAMSTRVGISSNIGELVGNELDLAYVTNVRRQSKNKGYKYFLLNAAYSVNTGQTLFSDYNSYSFESDDGKHLIDPFSGLMGSDLPQTYDILRIAKILDES